MNPGPYDACRRPADRGGTTLLADGVRIIGTLAEQFLVAAEQATAST